MPADCSDTLRRREPSIDAAEIKTNQHKVWSAAASGWRKHDSFLDVASGTGEPP